MLSTILNAFLQKQNEILQGLEDQIQKIVELEKTELEEKMKDAKQTIETTTKEIEYIKKGLKTLTYTKDERTAELEQKENLVQVLKKKFKEYPKLIEKLPKTVDNKKKEYKKIINELFKHLFDFKKIITDNIKLKKLLEISDEHLSYIIQLNNLITLEKFIKVTNLELKVKSLHKIDKILNFEQYMSIFLESLLFHILEMIPQEKLLKDKLELAKLALSYAKGILNYAKEQNALENVEKQVDVKNDIDHDYYVDLEKLCESELALIIGQIELSEFDLATCTSHLIYARDLLSSINSLNHYFKTVLSEKIELAEAWASDAYHLIYLLNSYKHWGNVSNSKDPEIKEISQITKEKIEWFITSQYGFPKGDAIKKITNDLTWPTPTQPSIIDKINAKY
ncbi:MAG: hypothetical protein ACTSRG_17315 [Candidatus Helarchaeota archaeon]